MEGRYTTEGTSPYSNIKLCIGQSEIHSLGNCRIFSSTRQGPEAWRQIAIDVLGQNTSGRQEIPAQLTRVEEDGVIFWQSASVGTSCRPWAAAAFI